MSDSVVKLRIDSKEYDANIKRAGQALTDYFNKVKEGGGTLKYLDDGVLEAVQAMGKLGTQANSVKGGLRELTQATSDMTVAYRSLTDEEKASPIGAAMAQSIQQMTERAGEMRDAMADVQASINNAASDTRRFDQAAAAMQGMTAGFQTVTGAAKLMGIQIGDDVEVIAKLQAAMAVTSGFQTMQNLLQKQSALMQGVNALQKEFNILAKANPYVLLATAAAAVVAAYVAWTSGARNAEKAQKALNGEIEATRTQLSQIDKDTDFSVGVAEAAGKSWKAIHELRLEAARTKLQLADMNYDKLAASGVASAEQMKKAAEMQQQAWDNVMKVLNEGTIHDIKMRNGGSGRAGGSRSGGGSAKELTEEQTNSAQIEKLTQEYITATNERRTAIEKEIVVLQKRNAEIQKLKDMAHGKQFDAGSIGEVTVTGNRSRQFSKLNEGNISGMLSDIKQQIQTADIGSELYNSLTTKMADTNTFKAVIETMVKNGIDTADINAQDLWKQIVSGENIDDAVWQGMVDKINAKLKEMGLDPIAIDFKTGGLVKTGKDTEKKEVNLTSEMSKIVGGVNGIFSGIESLGVELPQGLKDVMGGIQGVISIMTSISTILSAIEAINAADTLIPFARGGVVRAAVGYEVPGNHFSGDMVPALLNSGETVLNRAQSGIIASALEGAGNGFKNGQIVGRIEGEKIVLVANHFLKRSGQGELLTWKN